MKHCEYCGVDYDEPQSILRYQGKYYCDELCLGKYLEEQIDDEVEEEWIDTKENMRLCAIEDAYDPYLHD